MQRLLAAGAAFVLSTAPLSAQDVLGVFSGTVDGEARDWHVLDMDGDPGAAWQQVGPFAMATIFGFPQAGNLAEVSGALEISLTLHDRGDALAPIAGSVSYYADGPGQFYVPGDEEADVRVTLTEARIEGDRLHLTGAVEAELQRLVSFASETLDPDDRVRVTADFALTLAPQ